MKARTNEVRFAPLRWQRNWVCVWLFATFGWLLFSSFVANKASDHWSRASTALLKRLDQQTKPLMAEGEHLRQQIERLPVEKELDGTPAWREKMRLYTELDVSHARIDALFKAYDADYSRLDTDFWIKLRREMGQLGYWPIITIFFGWALMLAFSVVALMRELKRGSQPRPISSPP